MPQLDIVRYCLLILVTSLGLMLASTPAIAQDDDVIITCVATSPGTLLLPSSGRRTYIGLNCVQIIIVQG